MYQVLNFKLLKMRKFEVIVLAVNPLCPDFIINITPNPTDYIQNIFLSRV